MRLSSPLEWFVDQATATDARADFFSLIATAVVVGIGVSSWHGFAGAGLTAALATFPPATRFLVYRRRVLWLRLEVGLRQRSIEDLLRSSAPTAPPVIDVDPR